MTEISEQKPQLSIIIPVLEDDQALDALLTQLEMFAPSLETQIIVVDGAGDQAGVQQSDRSIRDRLGERACYLVSSPSRGGQVAAGCERATSDWLWVLHADSVISNDIADYLVSLITSAPALAWGRFDVNLPGVRLVASFMNARSRITKICTGDQGMFFAKSALQKIGGFPAQPLMEDIEVSKLLKHHFASQFLAPNIKLTSSSRRWRKHGVIRTVLTMWQFRLAYWRGVSAQVLYRRYYQVPHSE